MRIQSVLILLFIVIFPMCGVAQERPDWGKFFDEFDAKGTIVVVDERVKSRPVWIYEQERAGKRFSPASTFKIPHMLFALDAGAVRDEFQVFEWDGIERDFSGHNRDQDLRSAMRVSALWVLSGSRRKLVRKGHGAT